MRMEDAVCGSGNVVLDGELHDRHLAHWNGDSIQAFWTGESWDVPGDIFELSYNLALVLWRKIETDLAPSHEQVVRFIIEAQAIDAGEAACRAAFNTSLGDLVADFLGEGEWTPRPDTWPVGAPKGGPAASVENLNALRGRPSMS